MIIAVAGGSGFVGSHLISVLLRQGHTIRLFSRKKASSLVLNSYTGDIFSEGDLQGFLTGSDVLVNLIGRFEPPFNSQMDANAVTPFHLFNSAGKFGVKKILHISAAAVYGDAAVNKSPVETDDVMPSTPYGLSKFLGEETAQYCACKHGMDLVILRPTNIYATDSRTGVIHSMKSSIQERGTVTIAGDGMQVRDFVHVDDLTAAIRLIIAKGVYSGVYNIGSNEVLSIGDLANLFVKINKKNIAVQYSPAEPEYVRALRADSSRFRNDYGWKPLYNVTDTIRQMINAL